MTTIAQIAKRSELWFSDQMRRRGFAVEKKCIFWRKRGPLFDMFTGEILSGGANFRMCATIWSPWIDHPETGELGAFPLENGPVGGTLSSRFPEHLMGGELLPVGNEAEVDEALRQVLRMIDQHALTWMKSVDSCERYLSYVETRRCLGTSEFRAKVKHGIVRGFERES